MFKRKLKDDFELSECLFFDEKDGDKKQYDKIVFVIYDKLELLGFLKKEHRNANTLVCLFDKQFYSALSVLEEINGLVLFDESKTRKEVFKELKQHFMEKPVAKIKKTPFDKKVNRETKFQDYYKAMYFLI
ncbi:hypothetical protein [Flavobacterium sp. DG2-3]|uniref:hypothetical protein n=1 Tax=Flavobacterium sp. DG2-3 TaxID=3068317 RepID=UPI00273F2184|nr:hypothetical protein [Flavobacterium sp. DG2-3]MDP5201349.1 hypothetical protein [Flavobacterium sp. DG2-3]